MIGECRHEPSLEVTNGGAVLAVVCACRLCGEIRQFPYKPVPLRLVK